MRDDERERWATYVRDIADRMGLKDWTITVPGAPPEDHDDASTRMSYGRKVARVYLPDSFRHETPEEQRDIIVHELVHPHFAAMDGMAEDWLDSDRYVAFLRMFEYGVDAMAAVIAPHMPLPLTFLNPETAPMGRQQPKPVETAPKPKPKPKGTKPAK
jgi:hypothetical protein